MSNEEIVYANWSMLESNAQANEEILEELEAWLTTKNALDHSKSVTENLDGVFTPLLDVMYHALSTLRDIANNYDHEIQTKDHMSGYYGSCRVCTAQRTVDLITTKKDAYGL